jgi:hypothetical protein
MVKDSMHRLPVSLAVASGRTGKTAEHLTTSLRMLTAVREIGKLQTRLIRLRLWWIIAAVDNGAVPLNESVSSMKVLAQ